MDPTSPHDVQIACQMVSVFQKTSFSGAKPKPAFRKLQLKRTCQIQNKISIQILQQAKQKTNEGVVYILVRVHMASASPDMRPSIAMSSAYHTPCWFLQQWLCSEDRAWPSATTSKEKKRNVLNNFSYKHSIQVKS